MFVRKWLTKEEKDAENKLYEKCCTLYERNVPIANGKSLFVVVNRHIRKWKTIGV